MKKKEEHEHYWDFTGSMKAIPGINTTTPIRYEAFLICHECGAMKTTDLPEYLQEVKK